MKRHALFLATSMALLAGCGSTANAPAGAPAGGAPDGPVTPKVNRLVMSATPPDREHNDLKAHGMPDVPAGALGLEDRGAGPLGAGGLAWIRALVECKTTWHPIGA